MFLAFGVGLSPLPRRPHPGIRQGRVRAVTDMKSMKRLLTLLGHEDGKAEAADRIFSDDEEALKRQHTALAGACRYLLSKREELSPSPKNADAPRAGLAAVAGAPVAVPRRQPRQR